MTDTPPLTKALYADVGWLQGIVTVAGRTGAAIAADGPIRPVDRGQPPLCLPPLHPPILPRARQRKHPPLPLGSRLLQQQKDRGKKHHTITRALAFKWQRILLRCWHDHTPYDDALYMRSLKDRNPALYQLALTTKLPREEKTA